MAERTLGGAVAEQAAAAVRTSFSDVTIEDVHEVFKYGSVSEGIVSEEYDEAKSDAIIEALDALGVEVL